MDQNYHPGFSDKIEKELDVYCLYRHCRKTVYFPISHHPDPFYYYFNGCDDLNVSDDCQRCRCESEDWFRKTYPNLAPFLLPH